MMNLRAPAMRRWPRYPFIEETDMIVLSAQRALLIACLSTCMPWQLAQAETPVATASTRICDRPQELDDALAQARKVLSDSNLLRLCADALLGAAPSPRCQSFDPGGELALMQRSILSSTDAILAAWKQRGGGIDLLPGATLVALKGEGNQIDDLVGVVGDGVLGAIERCTGENSVACTSLKGNCLGDYKCYSDNTCACYTCNSGTCGIN
jgi:hypothetical protein